MIQVKIDNFEGPMDLLLHLIEKKQMKISEINIITVFLLMFNHQFWIVKMI